MLRLADLEVGFRVRTKLSSGQIVEGTIVVIFTASNRSNLLIESEGNFIRIDLSQVVELLSTPI